MLVFKVKIKLDEGSLRFRTIKLLEGHGYKYLIEDDEFILRLDFKVIDWWGLYTAAGDRVVIYTRPIDSNTSYLIIDPRSTLSIRKNIKAALTKAANKNIDNLIKLFYQEFNSEVVPRENNNINVFLIYFFSLINLFFFFYIATTMEYFDYTYYHYLLLFFLVLNVMSINFYLLYFDLPARMTESYQEKNEAMGYLLMLAVIGPIIYYWEFLRKPLNQERNT